MNKLSIITILLASRKTGCITATRFLFTPTTDRGRKKF